MPFSVPPIPKPATASRRGAPPHRPGRGRQAPPRWYSFTPPQWHVFSPPLTPLRETVASRWGVPCENVLGGHARLGTLGYSGEQVGHEVGAAALPAGNGEHRGDGVLQPLVSIGGHQFHPAEPPGGERAQEGQPKEAGPENSPPLLPNESARPSSSREESRRGQTWYLPWPTFVRGWRGGSAWPGGLRFGRRGYSEHRILLVARLPLHCTASRQFRYLRC